MSFLILAFSAWYVALVIHELGHFFAVKWVGYKMKPFVVSPFVFNFSDGKVAFKLMLSIFRGYVTFERISPVSFRKEFIVFAAGIFANLFVGVLLVTLYVVSAAHFKNGLYLVVGFASILFGIINLYPKKNAYTGLDSDALQLINLYKRWKIYKSGVNYTLTPLDFKVEISKAQNDNKSLVSIKFHNDDATPMDFVINIMEGYFQLDNNEAVAFMLTIHKEGDGHLQWFDHETATKVVSHISTEAQRCGYPFRCEVYL